MFSFKPADITILTDRDATALNIMAGLEKLVKDVKPGDHLVFHYSGHGSQVPDTSRDEKDALDEILCPYDLDWRKNVIRDDDLNWVFDPVPLGVHIEVFLDCCHSGTGLRAMDGTYRKQRFLPVPVEVMESCTAIKSIRPIKPSKIQVLWAACRSNQYAADALLNGKYCGAFTSVLCELVREANGEIPRNDLLAALRKSLKANRFVQVPQLETGRKLKKARLLGDQ
jgi:hypothetical protein